MTTTEFARNLVRIAGFPRNVLLIEDNPNDAAMTKSWLESKGCSVTSVPTAESSLELDLSKFDRAIVDCQLPGMSGIECIRKLVSKCPTLRCVLCTGHDDSFPEVKEALRQGCAVVQKPIMTSLWARQLYETSPLFTILSQLGGHPA